MGGSTLRAVVLAGLCALLLGFCCGVAEAASASRASAGRDDDVVVVPQNWRDTYPFFARFADTEGAEHVIDLAAVRFATDRLVTLAGRRSFREPDLSTFPLSNVRPPFAAGRRDLFIVQATSPRAQVALRRWLERARVPILGYIPDQAYLVKLDARAHSLASAQQGVFWIGLFQPAYRVAPDLDFIQDKDPGHPLKLRLLLDPEDYPSEGDVRAMLGTEPEASVIDVIRTTREWIVRLEGPVTLARAFAARPGCLWVERFVEFRLDNNVARSSSSIGTGRGTLPGPVMDVDNVWARGIHGEGQIASAADTGLSTGDIATPDSLHRDFGQVGSLTNPMRVLKGYALGRSSTWDDDQTIGGGHGTHTSGSIVGNGFRSGATPNLDSFPTSSFAGIAPKAQFVFQSVMDSTGTDGSPSLGGIPGDLRTLFLQTYNDGARVHSNSWGAAVNGAYSTDSQSVDDFAWTHKDMVITFSAGNSGTDLNPGSDGVVNTDSIGSPGTAKNCITVGASESYRTDFMYEFSPGICLPASYTWGWFNGASFPAAPVSSDLMANNANGMAAFSSRGPTDDSRFKPDITAPGVAIISTRTNKNQAYEQWGICNVPTGPPDQRPHYLAMGGTSMANPLTAGAATLVRQYYAGGWHPNNSDVTYSAGVPVQGFNPSSALVKATFVNGAWDMAPGQYGTGAQKEIPPGWDTGHDLPNNAEGYGRVDLEASLFPSAGWNRNAARSMHVRDVTSGLAFGGRNSYTYNVLNGADPLIATLAWTDPYAATGAGTKLVNNLDLEVTSPSGRRYTTNRVDAYVTTPTPFVRDSLNNVEQVKVTAPETGAWTIDVVGTAVPGNGVAGTTAQPYALVLSAVTCAMPAVPSPVTAVPNGHYRVDVSWGAAAGAAEYRVYRRYGTDQHASLLATVAAPGTSFTDTNAVPAFYSYYYVVKAASGGCESGSLSEVSAFPTGTCAVGPDFAGLASVTDSASGTCGLNLTWTAATARCGGPITYSVYRSTSSGFTPSFSNRIAAGLTTTTYADSGALTSGTTYYYVVRATDDRNGVEETNTVQRSGTPTGAAVNQALYGPQSFDALADGSYAGWTRSYFAPGNANDWRGVQSCAAHSGTKIFRFGGALCTGGYATSTHSLAWPPLAVPAGARNARVSFWHRWDFEANHDGGYLRIAFPGTPFYYVPGFAILSGPYSAGTNPFLGVPVWQGSQGTFVNTVVDLDAACRVIDAAGCAGKTVYFAFTSYLDATNAGTYTGWFIDDVQITADVPGSCSAAPLPVPSFSARSTSGTNLLEWQNPAAGAYGSAVVRYRTDGTFPTSAGDGTGVTCSGQNTAPGAYNSCSHAVANGTSCSYSLFVDNGSGVYSARRTVAATPFDTTGPRKWAYSTGAANLAPTGLLPGAIGTGGVYAFSNDRSLHAMNPTAAGGSWPRTGPFSWFPLAMNAPAQHRPPVVPLAGGPRVFLASQDGHAYAVDADSGAPVWTSAKLGDVLQANPAGLFSDLVPGAPDRLFVGTRNATSANTLYALDPSDGMTKAQFDNGGGASAIGIITGIAVDYATNYVYFTSRASGSPDTVWCLNATGGTLSRVWSYAAGDIDGSPVLYQGRVYVGTNNGRVKAIDPATGVEAWTYNAGADYPVKGHVFPHVGSSPPRLYFSGTSLTWAIQDDGTSASLLWSVFNTTNPSTPLHVAGTSHLLVGSSTGHLCELSTTNGAVEGCVNLGTGALGSPARDSVNGLFHVGSTGGVLHAVTLPVP